MPIYEVEAPDGRILEIEGNQPPSEKELDDIFATVGNKQQPLQPEYKKMSFKEAFSATPEELNENVKALGRQRLQQRQEWEQNHPVISEMQKAFQPNYRADLIDMQNQAEYGMQVPLGQSIKSDIKKAGQNLVPAINIGTAIATGGLGTAKGLFPAVGKAALQGGIQGGVEGLTGGIADEGLSVNALNRGLQGAGIGASVGGAIQTIPYVGKPIARALDNPRVQNAITSGLELLTSVPKKYSDLALQAELAGKSILGGKFNPETAYQGVERKIRTAKGKLPTDKQYREQYKQIGNEVREKLNQATKPNEYFDKMFNELGVKSGEYVQSLRKAKGEAVGKAKKGLKDTLDRFDYQDLINDIEQTFKTQQKDLVNPAEYDTGSLKQDLINLVKSGTRFNKRTVDTSRPATAFDNLYSHFLDYIEQNKNNPNIINNAQSALNKMSKNLSPELQNYYSNALNQDLDTIVNYGKVTPESLEGIVDWIGQQAKFRDNKYATPYAEPILQQLYGKFSNRLKNISPDLVKSNKEFGDLMSKLKALGIDEEKIPAARMSEIIKNYVYGNGKQIRSGQNVVLEDLLSPELMQDIGKVSDTYTAQQQLQKNIGEGVLNDISKYQNAPYATQEALEQLAPEQIAKFRNVFDQQATQKNILQPISAKSFERNPRLLSNRNDVATEEALAYLQERSGINFMNELDEIRAREALEALLPGQGGGSGSAQGFGNLLRTSMLGGVPSLAAITHNPLLLGGFGLMSPRLTGKGLIQNLGNLYRGLENPNVNRLRQIAVPLSVPTLQGGIVYNEDRY